MPAGQRRAMARGINCPTSTMIPAKRERGPDDGDARRGNPTAMPASSIVSEAPALAPVNSRCGRSRYVTAAARAPQLRSASSMARVRCS